MVVIDLGFGLGLRLGKSRPSSNSRLLAEGVLEPAGATAERGSRSSMPTPISKFRIEPHILSTAKESATDARRLPSRPGFGGNGAHRPRWLDHASGRLVAAPIRLRKKIRRLRHRV
jgi:hypothetical protein